MATNDFSRFYGRLEIRGIIELETPLRIGAGRGDDMGLADIPAIKDVLGRPFIPGSSFKGVLRSQIEMILRTIDEKLACLCVTDEKNHTCPTTKSRRREQGQELSDYDTLLQNSFGGNEEAMYLEGTCRVCQVFGAHGLASKVIIPDLGLSQSEFGEDGTWHGRYQIRHGVSIDRDTETAAEGRLYTGEAVPSGSRFDCEIIIENGSAADQGLVLLGLRAFEQGRVALGGAASRGLGQVKLTITGCREVSPEPAALIDYLVSGEGSPVDEAGRLNKITSLREELGV
jgi:CRISPR-associated RAMP protein (TIGR02581 family)